MKILKDTKEILKTAKALHDLGEDGLRKLIGDELRDRELLVSGREALVSTKEAALGKREAELKKFYFVRRIYVLAPLWALVFVAGLYAYFSFDHFLLTTPTEDIPPVSEKMTPREQDAYDSFNSANKNNPNFNPGRIQL